MQRRSFIRNTALSAVAVSASGFIFFDGNNYVGDCETTTDIIGPFYRPNAPVRSNMLVKNAPGQIITLSGTIRHKDCKSPLANACVEIWHCSADGVYDNDSPDFLYRAKTFCDTNGKYSFRTVLPVPYGIGGDQVRPAHFHILISAPGYQSLVSQLYFTGDPYLSKDPSSASPTAKRRILDIKSGDNGEKAVAFDVTMMENLPADHTVLARLAGKYIGEEDKTNNIELFEKDGLLWRKNDSPTGGNPYYYTGDNNFTQYGDNGHLHFEIRADNTIRANALWTADGKKMNISYLKA